MANEREAQFLELVREYPDSPMGHFSLGKLYLDEKRYADAAAALEKAASLDANYSAALVALGDARAQLGEPDRAREAYQRALKTPHGQKDASLQADIELRLRDL